MSEVSGTADFFHLHDANKNVMQLATSSGTLAADYAYGPYGSSLSQFASSPLGFSSERLDVEINLVYYNYRYYVLNFGCWNKPDPIYEYGGRNLYHFVINSPINKSDFLGLSDILGSVDCDLKSGTPYIKDPIVEHTNTSNCVEQHENQHKKNINNCCRMVKECNEILDMLGRGHEKYKCVTAYLSWANKTRQWDECSALKTESNCLTKALKTCKIKDCENCIIYKNENELIKKYMSDHCLDLLNTKQEPCYVNKVVDNITRNVNVQKLVMNTCSFQPKSRRFQ